MRKKQIFVLLTALAFLSVSSGLMMVSVTGEIQTESYDIEPLYDTKYADTLTLEDVEPDYGNTWNTYLIDDYYGYVYEAGFENIFNGTYGNIWIHLTGFDEYEDNGAPGYSPEDTWYFGYPWTLEGIPGYLNPGYRDWVTGEDLLEVLSAFDNNIHDTVVDNFGMYINDTSIRPGPFGDGKVQICVFNILDEFFYDPANALGFIMGYFWSQIADVLDTNAFHMDSYQWWRRQGEVPPIPPEYSHLSSLPLQYEGTFAHEFQHLVHHDVDADELSWVNEGCSTYAEYLCGYGFSPGHISEYLLWFWDTSLVIWEGYLSNYGAVFLWTFYMYEHYGGAALITQVCQDPANGIAGWMNALVGITDKSFNELFQDWAIANYLDNVDIYGGIYGYYDLEIGSAHSGYWDIPSVMYMWETGNPDSFDWLVDKYPNHGFPYAYGSSLPYVVNYVEFTKKGASLVEFTFDGDDFCGAPPTSGTYNWFAEGTGDSWFRVSQEFYIPAGGATLTFQNAFSIEADYDYGYVEARIVDTDDWYTLEGLYTTTDLAHSYNNSNCPVEREPTTYAAAGRWNAFTGDSGGIYLEEMVLPDMFKDQTIEIVFTYWTDPYTLGAGWYIDDIALDGFTDDCEDFDGWTVINTPEGYGWDLNDQIIWNDFEASFINILNFYGKKTGLVGSYYEVFSMDLDEDTEEGNEMLFLVGIDHIVESIGVFVVANQPGYEHIFRASYSFEAHVIGRRWRWY